MNIRKQQGFTIIEVVLVLAIAGLIFLMVFIALPTLQTNQRDTQRRDDVARFKAQVNQYQANNKGKVPAQVAAGVSCVAAVGNAAQFVNDYLKTWEDPTDGATYLSKCKTTAANVTAAGDWFYANAPAVPPGTPGGNKCSGEAIVPGSGTRQYAMIMKLEGSGTICVDNQ